MDTRDAIGDLWFVLLVLLGLGILWFATGGPERAKNEGLFLSPPPPLGTGTTYGGSPGGFLSFLKAPSNVIVAPSANQSSQKGSISLEQGGASATDADQEYVVLRNVGGAPVDVTGWHVQSSPSKQYMTIGQAAELPYSAQVNAQHDIVLQPGDSVYVISGHSPIGTSFRTNECTGYFSQFQNFTPSLRFSCPTPGELLAREGGSELTDICRNFIEGLPQCEMTFSPSPDLPESCQNFIATKLNYNTCVADFKSDPNFMGTEWYTYLNREGELWKQQFEVINLLDAQGKTVDTITY